MFSLTHTSLCILVSSDSWLFSILPAPSQRPTRNTLPNLCLPAHSPVLLVPTPNALLLNVASSLCASSVVLQQGQQHHVCVSSWVTDILMDWPVLVSLVGIIYCPMKQLNSPPAISISSSLSHIYWFWLNQQKHNYLWKLITEIHCDWPKRLLGSKMRRLFVVVH